MIDVNEKKKRPCVVPVCHGERFDLVHKFPMESERTVKWLDALHIPELYKVPLDKLRTSYFICSRHFRSQDYKNVVSRHLNKTAVPSLNLKNLDQMGLVADRSASIPVKTSMHVAKVNLSCIEGSAHNLEIREVSKRKFVNEEIPETEEGTYLKAKLLCTKGAPVQQKNIASPQENTLNAFELIVDERIPKYIEEIAENCDFAHIPATEEAISCETLQEEALQDEVEESLILVHDDADARQLANMGMATNFIEVSHPDYSEVLTLDNFWLRDHCRCHTCYNFDTNQRNYNVLDIPLEVKPLLTEVRNGLLYVKWDDGHESNYNFEFLYQSQIGFFKRNYENIRCLWNSTSAPCLDYARICLSKLVISDDAVKAVIKSLITFGFAFIENVPPNQDMTEMVVRRLFPIQKTFFGEMWSFTNRRDHLDTAYTKEYLGPHTDNTYFNDAAGLQVLHCIKHNGSGGETFLVDGYKIINDLRIKNPQAYENLRKVNVPAEYIEEGQHHCYSAPMIRVNDITNTPEQIRFNLYDRSIFNSLPQTEMFEFYRDFRELIKLVHCEDNRWTFKLKPGTTLIFDNWRVLHGREKYTGTREVSGCYVSRTDFMSKARTLDLIS